MIEGLNAPNGPASLQGNLETKMMTREEHMLKEQSLRMLSTRNPRRSQTTHEYQGPRMASLDAITSFLQQAVSLVQPTTPGQLETVIEAPLAEISRPSSPIPQPVVAPEAAARPQRPTLGKPRRSYSVMDYEPVPHHQRPSTSNLTFSTLPAELHFAIFDKLDPIDSTCLGLTNKHFYDIHRRLRGSVRLSARRDGPNDMEWTWHLACTVKQGLPINPATPTTTNTLGSGSTDGAGAGGSSNLAALRVRGQGLCRKCGVSRCELHKHIGAEWMPAGHEYCTVQDKWRPAAAEGAKSYCYLSSPKNPNRCGRHRVRKEPAAVSPAAV